MKRTAMFLVSKPGMRTRVLAVALILAGLSWGSFGRATQRPTDPPVTVDQIDWVNELENPPIGVTHGTFSSASMNVKVGYSIYLPPDYERTTERYPVVYRLHGRLGSERRTSPAVVLHRAIKEGRVQPMVLVLANGGVASGSIDNPNTGVMGESVIIRELIPHIENIYRVMDQRQGRGLLGFSMGGGGAVRLALKHPDLFASVVSLGGSMHDYRLIMDRFSVVDQGLAKEYDPYILASQISGAVGGLRLKLFIGTEDQLLESNRRLSLHFQSLNLAHGYQELNGIQHNLGQYYGRVGNEVFEFLSTNLENTGSSQ